MSELGQLLKNARMEKGITLDDLQETTKIRKRYLESIEEGNYKVLPGNFYVRAFIKTYAEAVGLNQAEVLRLYGNTLPSYEVPQTQEYTRRKRSASKSLEKWSRRATTFIMILFFIMIFSIVYYYMNKSYHGQKEVDSTKISDKISQQKGDAVFTSTPSVKPTSTPTPSPTPKTVVTLESQTGVNYVYSVQNASSVQVELQVTGDNCWTQVNQGNSTGAQIIQQIFLNGTLQKWEDPNGLWIRLGKPLAAQIKINGVQINIPEKVNPINLQINLK